MTGTNRLWHASEKDIKRGYEECSDIYCCLFCDAQSEKGIIYPDDGVLCDAEKFMRRHVEKAHVSAFHSLLGLDKRATGLSEHQAQLLKLFYEGKNDIQIQQELGIGSASTIRNHRFMLREKERQARVFTALMDLLREKTQSPKPEGAIVKSRDNDKQESEEEHYMDRKQILKQMAKETRIEAGAYLIRNVKNGKILIMSTPDLKTINGRKMEMAMGSFPNALLKEDLDRFGPEAFEFEILEVLKPREDGYFNIKDELKRLENKWINQYESYGERGYNKKP